LPILTGTTPLADGSISEVGYLPDPGTSTVVLLAGDFSYEGTGGLGVDPAVAAVGSVAALAILDDTPLPDEPLDLSGVAADIVDRVNEYAAILDRVCDELLDIEYRTAVRRFLVALSVADPAIFRRKAKVETGAAAIVWIVGKANNLFTSWGPGLHVDVKDIAAAAGASSSQLSQRAGTRLKALGLERGLAYHRINLGSSDYLVASRRQAILASRDRGFRT